MTSFVCRRAVLCVCGLMLIAVQAGGQPSPRPESAVDRPEPFERTAMELTSSLDIGWNLGNGLDAPVEETAWGNPPITPELIRAVADAGFDVVRVPVTWSPHIGDGPGYAIDAAFMDRVEEVVGYVHDAGLTAILNLHHDGADNWRRITWISLNPERGQTAEEHTAAVEAKFRAVWRQIAERFKGHGERLIFESMNEVHVDWGDPEPRHHAVINRLNQAFVDTVRATGGNNARRYLLMPGYMNHIPHTVPGFELPDDPAEDRLMVSVHFYDPNTFALQAKTPTWGAASAESDDWGQEDHVLEQFEKIRSAFVDRGVPVVMGEYGATYQAGREAYRLYYLEYVTRAARQHGMLPIYWDNGGQESGEESFGLFDRATAEPIRPELIATLQRAARGDYDLDEIEKPEATPAP